jgi:3-oxoacyl-[acyl-carrier-protein] synthase III
VKPFVLDRYGRIVFPFNFVPELDFSIFDTLEDFEAVVRRDFEDKARSEAEIVADLEAGAYRERYWLLRDLAGHLFWSDRYAMTMYERRPMRWRDVPRQRADVFLPRLVDVDVASTVEALHTGYRRLPSGRDERTEDVVFGVLLEVFRGRQTAGVGIEALNPTVGEALGRPDTLVCRLLDYAPDYPGYSDDDILGYAHPVPELEALMRHAMVLHDQFRWDRERAELVSIKDLAGDDVVIVLHPLNADVARFIRRARSGRRRPRDARRPAPTTRSPVAVCAPVDVRARLTVMPRLEALAVCKGERACTNEDLVRNAAYCWSPMTADEIREKTGIVQRLYTELDLEELALRAARGALGKSGRRPEEIGAVLFCSCTSTRACPSVAAWISGHLGIPQTHASYDLIAACAGLSYGLSEAARLMQESGRPALVVCAEKFSDKIGTVRASRMIFGDSAAALVLGPAAAGSPPDLEVFQTYASGPMSEVESIIWPNPAFDNSITVHGPPVRALVSRYLSQMVGELAALPDPDGRARSLLDAIDLVVPHQANKTMVTDLAREAGLPPERLYFNIERVGNTSAASIPLALHDAVRDGVIDRPLRVFAPGFGAGAVGGYVVMRVTPAIAA